MIFNTPRGMDKTAAMQLLPKVGDKRMEYPTIDEDTTVAAVIGAKTAQPCTVIEVNRAHLWYRVKFENGVVECYKVPKVRPISGGPAR